MQITIDSKPLRKAIEQVLPAVDNRASLPVLREILMRTVVEAGQAYLELAATNLEITLWSRVPLPLEDLEQEGSRTVNPKELISVLKRLRLVTRVKLQLQTETTQNDKGEEVTTSYLLVTPSYCSKETETGLIKLSDYAESFPQLLETDFAPTKQLKLSLSNFLAGVRRVAFTASTDETRPTYTGVWATIQPANNFLDLATCDFFRLAVTELPLLTEDSQVAPFTLNIPAQSLKALAKAISSNVTNEDEAANITISLNSTGGYAVFRVASLTCAISLITGNIPDYHTYIAKDSKLVFQVATDEFKRVISALQQAETERVRGDKKLIKAEKLMLELSETRQELLLGLIATDSNNSKVKCDAKVKIITLEKGESSFPFALDVNYLSDMLEAASEWEQLTICLNAGTKPSLFQPFDSDTPTKTNWVIMPIHPSQDVLYSWRQSVKNLAD